MENNKLSEKFKMTKEKERELWKDCVFVFDSSALLNFYEYPEETRKDIFENRFEGLINRLWIPQHVIFEFAGKHKSCIKKPEGLYKALRNKYINVIETKINELQNDTKKEDKHPYFKNDLIKEFKEQFLEFKEKIEIEIEKKVGEIAKMAKNDTVRDNFSKYLKIGSEYDYHQLTEIAREGEFRYRNEIPPGYMDAKDKKGFQKYGDLIIWKQTLEFAKKNSKNIILITDDEKEDWWVLDKKHKIIRPRTELIREMRTIANTDFWMYTSPDFIRIANVMLPDKTSDETFEVVKEAGNKLQEWMVHELFHQWLIKKFTRNEIIELNDNISGVSLDYSVINGYGRKAGFIVKYIPKVINIFQSAEKLFDVIVKASVNWNIPIFIVFICENLEDRNLCMRRMNSEPLSQIKEHFDQMDIEIIYGHIENSEFNIFFTEKLFSYLK